MSTAPQWCAPGGTRGSPFLLPLFRRPIPQGVLAQFTIIREHASFFSGGFPTFTVRSTEGAPPHSLSGAANYKTLKHPLTRPDSSTGDIFCMASRRRKGSMSANYLVTLDPEDLSKESGSVVAKVRALDQVVVAGKSRIFNVYTDGDNPKDRVLDKNVREELANIEYEKKEWGDRGPIRMVVTIPTVDAENRRKIVKPIEEEDLNQLQAMRDKAGLVGTESDIVVLRNKEAKIRPDTGAYVLDFGGRATQPSVKNFQLVPPGSDEIALQFGKIGKDEFTMDVRWPMTPAQAFGVCLTCFENNGHN